MKKLIIALFLCSSLTLYAQTNINDYVNLGAYSISYTDTLLYVDHTEYNEYTYQGREPLFVQIWQPSSSSSKKPFLKYADLLKRKVPSNLEFVYQNLSTQAKNSIINNCITYDLMTGDPIAYSEASVVEVFSKVLEMETQSFAAPFVSQGKYPVIMYHHGTQGSSWENVWMAEYFASRGYIFISANFHLPYSKQVYGLVESTQNNLAKVKKLNSFAKEISVNKPVYYIGHSWGAQVAWCYLYENNWVDAFVSMETTIETKKDELEIKDKWPFVYQTIKTEKRMYNLPILMFGYAPQGGKFPFFENINSTPTLFVSSKQEFAHESYTSVFLMRYFLRNEIKVPDSTILENQLQIYAKHLNLIEVYLKSKDTQGILKDAKWKEVFNISIN